jgi:hypothetical protein
VKAEVEVPALEVVLIELRQFLEATELALEATGRPERPLRVLLGEIPRSELFSPNAQVLKLELVDGMLPKDLLEDGDTRPWRPLVQVWLSSEVFGTAAELGPGALRLIIRFATLFAVIDIGC